jgi:hypothetical protein
MPVELVRGGMAFGEAKGWDVEGMLEVYGAAAGSVLTKVETHGLLGSTCLP